jgi:hypothetical protein
VLVLDADERVSDELRNEIERAIQQDGSRVGRNKSSQFRQLRSLTLVQHWMLVLLSGLPELRRALSPAYNFVRREWGSTGRASGTRTASRN